MIKVLLADIAGVYRAQGFTLWMEQAGIPYEEADVEGIEGTHCYCDAEAEERLTKALENADEFKVRFIGSGDYHYLSCLLAQNIKDQFSLVLMDNHPDNQEPAFGGVLSCGSWVKEMQEKNPMLRDVLTVGPEGCPQGLPDEWLEARRGERVYISLDKDVMDRPWARTDWSQGTLSLEAVKGMLGRLMEAMEVVAADICGELAPSKGAMPEDLRINYETNVELYNFINNHLK